MRRCTSNVRIPGRGALDHFCGETHHQANARSNADALKRLCTSNRSIPDRDARDICCCGTANRTQARSDSKFRGLCAPRFQPSLIISGALDSFCGEAGHQTKARSNTKFPGARLRTSNPSIPDRCALGHFCCETRQAKARPDAKLLGSLAHRTRKSLIVVHLIQLLL